MGIQVAVVGTGAVGSTILQVLEERNFPVDGLKLLATSRSAGKKLVFRGQEYTIEETTPEAFEGVDLALFAGGKASTLYAHEAVKRGAVVIDNGSAFRMDPEVPLVVPEVNPEALKGHKGIIANPNCSTIQMVVALQPIHALSPIRRVIVSTYQAVSGAGQEAMDELENQTRGLLEGRPAEPEVFQHQIAMNLIPHIDVFMEDGYTKEEWKVLAETKKMLDPKIKVTCTAVRVPVFIGHSEAVNIEFEKPITADEAREILRDAPGCLVVDKRENGGYITPVECAGEDATYISRIREDPTVDNGLNMWVVSDNLRKGAALNTVQIAELLVARGLIQPRKRAA